MDTPTKCRRCSRRLQGVPVLFETASRWSRYILAKLDRCESRVEDAIDWIFPPTSGARKWSSKDDSAFSTRLDHNLAASAGDLAGRGNDTNLPARKGAAEDPE
jgi:hypothetical protein